MGTVGAVTLDGLDDDGSFSAESGLGDGECVGEQETTDEGGVDVVDVSPGLLK